MEGDPDRPIVVGRVYNGNNMPPFTLPDHKLKSIIRDHFGNEIVMDGTQGKESISIYSPAHHSLMQLGKSIHLFTASTDAKLSIDSETYSLGRKISMTKGWSFSADNGAWFSLKAGFGAAVVLGADFAASVGVKGTFSFGGLISYSKSWNFSYGLSREYKATKGAYKRVSASDAILDSQKDCYVTGGLNDNTMLKSNDDELILSYCANDGRKADLQKADSAATKAAMAMMGVVTVVSAASVIGMQWTLDKDGAAKSKADATKSIETQFTSISTSNAADAALAIAGGAAVISAMKGTKDADFKPPAHPDPTAKVTLDKKGLRLFAGKSQEAELVMMNDGTIDVIGKAGIDIKTADGGMNLFASKELKLSSHDGVKIDCELRHKNMTVIQ
jgi:hypothetical protein